MGTLLNGTYHGDSLGYYNDKTEDFGMNGEIGIKDFTFGFNNWVRSERYGPYYAGDRAQNSATWTFTSNQFYLDHDKQVNDKFKIETSFLYRRNRVYGEWAEAAAM